MKITGPTLHPSAHDNLTDWSRRDLVLPHVPRIAKLGYHNIVWGWTNYSLIENADNLAEYFEPVKKACAAVGIKIIRDGKPRLWDRSVMYMRPEDVGAFLAMME